GSIVVIRDITERKKMELRIREMSLSDELTGLRNRRGFMELARHGLEGLRRRPRKAWLIFIDLDRFKQINDRFGHAEGDRALFQASEVLRKSFRQSDVVARFGGDEFAALVLGDAESECDILLERLKKNLAEVNAPGSRYALAFSICVVAFDPEK